MTDQEILYKAHQKATSKNEELEILCYDEYGDIIPEVLIFNHDFAKALWGETEHDAWTDEDGGTTTCRKCDGGDVLGSKSRETLKEPYVTYGIDYCWQWHLQQMVVAEDPIKYLGENL